MTESVVLVLNAGSSSLKYQLLTPATGDVLAKGLIERIGEAGSVPDHEAAFGRVLTELSDGGHELSEVSAVGHRVVHGGPDFSDPVIIDDQLVTAVEELIPLAPLHNPAAVAGIRAARHQLPDVPQVAVFDTAFFATLPDAARTYAIPRDLAARHRIRRYGFHGTSHRYVSGRAAAFLERDPSELNLVVFHLGNGCSASAVRGGRAVDTSMGLTPLQGLVMGTRSGDVDPSLPAFLSDQAGLSVQQTDTVLNKQSGLKGLSGVNDFRELIGLIDGGDADAQLAFDVFVHRLRHYLGAYAAILGRLDAVVFTAGVGENNARVRAAALADLPVLGIELDSARNEAAGRESRMISSEASTVAVLVVPTNEELAIAQQTADLIA